VPRDSRARFTASTHETRVNNSAGFSIAASKCGPSMAVSTLHVSQGAQASRLQIIPLTQLPFALSRESPRSSAPMVARQVQHRRRHPLGARRTECQSAARRQDAGRDLRGRRHAEARPAVRSRPAAHRLREAARQRISRDRDHPARAPRRAKRVFFQRPAVSVEGHPEAFHGHRIGRTSYSIMAQGQIDQILSSKPEERRAVFEEAAGITKYKSARREAMNKLRADRSKSSRGWRMSSPRSRGRSAAPAVRRPRRLRYKRVNHRLRHLALAWSTHSHAQLAATLGRSIPRSPLCVPRPTLAGPPPSRNRSRSTKRNLHADA